MTTKEVLDNLIDKIEYLKEAEEKIRAVRQDLEEEARDMALKEAKLR